MRPRFRIRTLLVLTALAAAVCYWWISAPTRVAKQFKQVVENGDFPAADAMFVDAFASMQALLTWNRDSEPPAPGTTVKLTILPRTWMDLICRQRRMAVSLFIPDANVGVQESFAASEFGPVLIASPRGISGLYFDFHL